MKIKLLNFILLFVSSISMAQVGVGTNTPDNSAALEVQSTTKGFLPPRMTQSQIVAISNPAEGLVVYCTDCSPKELYVFDGTFFNNVASTKVLVSSVTGLGGAVWMDRNLGASQIATSVTHTNAYGDLYQWGRNTDGHQSRSSNAITGPVSNGSEGSNFIYNSSDWLSTPDDTRWNGTTKGVHDPCPDGFRIPTETEWNTERVAWASNNAAGAFAGPLKLTVGGRRNSSDALLSGVGDIGSYWTSTVNSTNACRLLINSTNATVNNSGRATGFSIRCIQE
jgi:uncharacterized protein (TIGR02145 family)